MEADGHDVCTVTFSDSSEKEAQKPRDSASTSSCKTCPLEQKRNLEYYIRDVEKDGYESDVSDCDRMVIDENRDVTSDVSQNSDVLTDSVVASDVEGQSELKGRTENKMVELIPTRKVSRRKASVPIKQGTRDDDTESEDEGLESQKSRLSSQGEGNTIDDNNKTNRNDSLTCSKEAEAEPAQNSKNIDKRNSHQSEKCTETKKESKMMPEKEKVQSTSKFKLNICESGISGSEKLSPKY